MPGPAGNRLYTVAITGLLSFLLLATSVTTFQTSDKTHSRSKAPPVAAAGPGLEDSLRQRASPSAARIRLQLQSSLEPNNQSFVASNEEKRDFYIFHDVILQNDSLLYFVADDAEPPADLPRKLRLSRYEAQLELPVIVVNSSNRQEHPYVCSRRSMQAKPALLFSGTPWDFNYYEFFATVLAPLFQTATATGLLKEDRIQELANLTDRTQLIAKVFNQRTNAPFTLISGRPEFFGTPWGHLASYMTAEQLMLQHITRMCLRTLVVSEDGVLRFLYERKWEMVDSGYREARGRWLGSFVRFLIAAEKVHLRMIPPGGKAWPESVGDSGAIHKRPRVVLVSRPLVERGIYNEAEIVEYLTTHWDVNVTATKFDMGLASSIALMQETDVLIGMHGAGLTNALFMKREGVLLQLLPYGWDPLGNGDAIRSAFSNDISAIQGGLYLQWTNPIAENAFFQEWQFDRALADWDDNPHWGPKVTGFQLHPDKRLPLPKPRDFNPPLFWIYQSTLVDMKSFGPVLDKAMEHVKAGRLQATL